MQVSRPAIARVHCRMHRTLAFGGCLMLETVRARVLSLRQRFLTLAYLISACSRSGMALDIRP